MKSEAAYISLIAAGKSQALSGTVRITASEMVSYNLLPAILRDIHRAEPKIDLELHPSDKTDNLLFREADIAVRMYRPQQLDVITRKIGSQKLGVYATQSYLKEYGQPKTLEETGAHCFIGYDRSDMMIREMQKMGLDVDASFFELRCDNAAVYWQMIRSGCGIGIVAQGIASADPSLVQLMPELTLPELPVWLTAHKSLARTPRIRRVYDLLAEGLTKAMAQSSGPV